MKTPVQAVIERLEAEKHALDVTIDLLRRIELSDSNGNLTQTPDPPAKTKQAAPAKDHPFNRSFGNNPTHERSLKFKGVPQAERPCTVCGQPIGPGRGYTTKCATCRGIATREQTAASVQKVRDKKKEQIHHGSISNAIADTLRECPMAPGLVTNKLHGKGYTFTFDAVSRAMIAMYGQDQIEKTADGRYELPDEVEA